jgi:hypothetical protein
MYWALAGGSGAADFRRYRSRSEGGAKHMIKWNYRATRIALVLGAVAAFAVSAGANAKWG